MSGRTLWITSLLSLAGVLVLGQGACRSAEKNAPDAAAVARLIEKLGDADFEVREQAQEALARLGFAAFEPLSAAAESRDLEVASRARYLLRLMRSKWSTDKDSAKVKELLEGYDSQSGEVRAQRIRELASLPDLSGVPALCRLIRFEKSPMLSTYVAAAMINAEPVDATSAGRLGQMLRENLAGCQRLGAKYLLAHVRLREEPKGGLAAWAALVETERQGLSRVPKETTAATVVPLMYALAEARARAGDAAGAEKNAEEARGLEPTQESTRLDTRLEAAAALRHHGRIAWAEQEYRLLAASKHPVAVFYAHRALAEMLHDQGKHLAAAESCEQAVKALTEKDLDWGDLIDHPKQLRARMYYFYACHYEEQGDQQKQQQYLDQALKADVGELDTLIAYYRLPNLPAETRKKIVTLVQRQAELVRRQTVADPDNVRWYNEYAWLVGNTEGDLEQALRFAERSLELSPNAASLLDTLAHVHFARGDLENAVRWQAKAAELEPHSGVIQRELKRFRAALASQRGEKR